MAEGKTRPTFLTVLCILSFIGLGFSILGAVINMVTAPMMQKLSGLTEMGMNEAMEDISRDAPSMMPFMKNIMGSGMAAMEHMFTMAIANLVFSLIALFGVIKMWQLKKFGFYLYTGGKIVLIAMPIILIGGFVGAMTLIGAIFPIAFIIMYALNLKDME